MAYISLKESICRDHRMPRDLAVLTGRSELLGPEDRALIDAVFLHGQKTADLARLTGKSQTTIRQRVRRISRRMTSRRFLEAARLLPYLQGRDVPMVRLAWCQGLGRKKVGQMLGMSEHTVRRRLERLDARLDALRAIKQMTNGNLKLDLSAWLAGPKAPDAPAKAG